MKLFLFQNVTGKVSNSYHNGGSVAILAADEGAAMNEIESEDCTVDLLAKDWENVRVFELSEVHRADAPEVFVFPDAGCC